MPNIDFIEPGGTRRRVQAAAGLTLMEVAVQNGIAGIVALCGGACACATCHVYIAPPWSSKLPAIEDMEEGMLENAWERRESSRLSCQVQITAALDGLEATVPRQQGS